MISDKTSIMAIWKYPFNISSEFVLTMPSGARLLHVDEQDGVPTLWAMVNPEAEAAPRKFHVIGTGHEILGSKQGLVHVGTFQQGELVWHVFDAGEEVRS